MEAAQVTAHVRRRLPAFGAAGEAEPLAGGLLNFVWRVRGRGGSVIVKMAPPYVATVPDIPLDPQRLSFEARALRALAPDGILAGVSEERVRAPRLLDFDAERFVAVMEDAGRHPSLGDWLYQNQDPGDETEAGAALGRFVGTLHGVTFEDRELAATFHNAAVQDTRLEVQYRAVEDLCRQAGLDDAPRLGARAVELGAGFQRPGRCLIMGDLWPSSVLVTPRGLRVIDWELTHFGQPAQDVGHLGAHLWMYHHRAPTEEAARRVRTVWLSFLGAYARALRIAGSKAGELVGAQMLCRCALHMGCEILTRTVGPFKDRYLYSGLPPTSSLVGEAIDVAARHLRRPESADTFAPLAQSSTEP